VWTELAEGEGVERETAVGSEWRRTVSLRRASKSSGPAIVRNTEVVLPVGSGWIENDVALEGFLRSERRT
jgi:hypothetical protein